MKPGSEHLQHTLSAFVKGRLNAKESAHVGQLLRTSPQARDIVRRLRERRKRGWRRLPASLLAALALLLGIGIFSFFAAANSNPAEGVDSGQEKAIVSPSEAAPFAENKPRLDQVNSAGTGKEGSTQPGPKAQASAKAGDHASSANPAERKVPSPLPDGTKPAAKEAVPGPDRPAEPAVQVKPVDPKPAAKEPEPAKAAGPMPVEAPAPPRKPGPFVPLKPFPRKPLPLPNRILNVNPPHVSTDKSIKYDWDIVYVRVPRDPNKHSIWAEVAQPFVMDAGGDLMLLHPDGKEELLVAGGAGSVADPYVSFDGQWVYYAKFHDLTNAGQNKLAKGGSDIYKIQVKSRKIVQLTHQELAPNTAAPRGKSSRKPAVFNQGPCPLPGGKIMFTSSRNGYKPPRGADLTMQLFVMDEDGRNVDTIGHLNLGCALHPVILKDGRVMFASMETQGIRSASEWGVWAIRPDGTNWEPLMSSFGSIGGGQAISLYHFQTQLSDESIVVERYYHIGNAGHGTYYKFAPRAPERIPFFGPGYRGDPRNPPLNEFRGFMKQSFSPYGLHVLTRFGRMGDGHANVADPKAREDDPKAVRVGKVTHPSGAPDNHLLTVWSPGPGNMDLGNWGGPIDSGIYLIKSGQPIDEPGQMRLIKNDPKYNEQWPRALVPYKRICGVDQPYRFPPLANDGKLSAQLPEGTPFGLVGTSSFYKRDSYPEGVVPRGKVTATYAGGNSPLRGLEGDHWMHQGADAGLYNNSDICAVRILIQEPTSGDPYSPRQFQNLANERLRIWGEFPLRKFGEPGGVNRRVDGQPRDPDGNPDTSFLAKVPANVSFTFQTIDKHGMVLNMSQTWHQLRPGEIRNDCGGCHAHSQKPTLFQDTAAARPDYAVWDPTTKGTPLLTTKAHDQSGKKWDAKDESGLRYEKGIKNVEYFRDVKPILDKSCTACHTGKTANPPAKLIMDDDSLFNTKAGRVPGTYFRLAMDGGTALRAEHSTGKARFGYLPPSKEGVWHFEHASRYIWGFQSRRSLLIWKVFGQRLDGFTNDDLPTEKIPGDPNSLQWKGKPVPSTRQNQIRSELLTYNGSPMPPPEAVQSGKVKPLSDEDKLTLVRWIDLGCPIDLANGGPGGWMFEDNRPTLTLTYPGDAGNEPLTRILVGMYDYYTGLDMKSFQVTADFPVDGVAAGRNLAAKFKPKSDGVWELVLPKPLTSLAKGKLTVSVKNKQGNTSKIERTFSVGATRTAQR